MLVWLPEKYGLKVASRDKQKAFARYLNNHLRNQGLQCDHVIFVAKARVLLCLRSEDPAGAAKAGQAGIQVFC